MLDLTPLGFGAGRDRSDADLTVVLPTMGTRGSSDGSMGPRRGGGSISTKGRSSLDGPWVRPTGAEMLEGLKGGLKVLKGVKVWWQKRLHLPKASSWWGR